jgi:hypothetical protein
MKPGTSSIDADGLNAGRDITLVAGDYVAAREEHPRTFTIPAPPRDFTGRSKEIDTLVQALTQGKRAAISGVTGMGGVGKSALASVIAYRVVTSFPDAELWLDLRGLDDAPMVPTDAMRQVILAFDPSADIKKADDDKIVQMYRDTLHGKRALVVLDNAKDAVQVRELLKADAAFIITSRHYFVEPGLSPIRLDVMTKQDAEKFLHELCPRLGQKEQEELTELCGYLPLAIKIAGRFLAVHDDLMPEWYVEQLKTIRLKMLKESNELDVEATFALTYDRLDEEKQARWRLLGIFPAPFHADAAAYMWEIEEQTARLTLSELRNMSLVEYDKDADKYRLHDLLRDFARGR